MKHLTALAVIALTSVATIANAQDSSMDEVAEGVYHFAAFGYSSMVVVGDNGVLVADPSFAGRSDMLAEAIKGVTDKPVTHVALSHEHYDHVGGTESFPGAEIILQENGVDVLKVSTLMPMPAVTSTFDDSMSVDLGGQTVELHHIAVADGVATTVMRVADSNVVFSADLYMPQEFSPHEFKEDTNFLGLSDVLDQMVEWNPSYAINAHSTGNSVDALKENAVMLNELQTVIEDEFKAAFATGDPSAPWNLLFTISGQIDMPKYAEWKNYENGFPGYVRRMALSVLHGG